MPQVRKLPARKKADHRTRVGRHRARHVLQPLQDERRVADRHVELARGPPDRQRRGGDRCVRRPSPARRHRHAPLAAPVAAGPGLLCVRRQEPLPGRCRRAGPRARPRRRTAIRPVRGALDRARSRSGGGHDTGGAGSHDGRARAGDPDASATASPAAGVGPIYFNEDVQPDPTQLLTSLDGGVAWLNVPVDATYHVTAAKEGVSYPTVKFRVDAADATEHGVQLYIASPPDSLEGSNNSGPGQP